MMTHVITRSGSAYEHISVHAGVNRPICGSGFLSDEPWRMISTPPRKPLCSACLSVAMGVMRLIAERAALAPPAKDC